MRDSLFITHEKIEQYCKDHSTPPSHAQTLSHSETLAMFPQAARMQVGPIEGQFLTFMAQISGAKNILEIGTFTGYSALSFAQGLPDDGRLITLDIDPKATALAQQLWDQSPDGKKIELRLGPALESLTMIQNEMVTGQLMPFEIIFIDADKRNYSEYYEAALHILAPTGTLLVDNVLWGGGVLNPEDKSDHAMVAFNSKIRNDERIHCVMLPIRDGIYVIRKRQLNQRINTNPPL